MVGLVIVSHSAQLAAGVAELARGMAGPEVRIAAAGGLDAPDHPLGTDVGLILRALTEADSEDGVLVLMDLGSAILSTEVATEMLTEEQRARVWLCEAPLVEGAIAAAVQAKLGSPLARVAAEARAGLGPKIAQLAPQPGGEVEKLQVEPVSSASDLQPSTLSLVVRNRLGLHARPAARFVQTVNRFQAQVYVSNTTNGRGPANAKSINAVATLGVRHGHTITLTASGPEAQAALEALQKLAEENFGDADEKDEGGKRTDEVREASSPSLQASSLQGLAASPGIALGPARRFITVQPQVPQHRVDDPAREWDALLAAIEKTRDHIQRVLAETRRRADAHTAEIFEAHLLFLEDEALREPAHTAIFEERLNAAAAWQHATHAIAEQLHALEDEYQRARAADVEDIGRQVVAALLNVSLTPGLAEPGILIARDLAPADTAGLDPQRVQGIATAFGGPTSHSAILARSLGLPAVVGLGERVLEIAEGTPLILDGEAGRVIAEPDPALEAEYVRKRDAAREAAAQALRLSAAVAVTRDGRRIEVVANIGGVKDARAAVEAGAEGVGLFRTEFLFLDRQTAPTEEEQYTAYRAASEVMGPDRPVIIRTLDVGGDKPLPYVQMGHEENPFLGWRAVRMCLDNPDFFKQQLRAIVRVAADYPLKVMFPMIATLAEFRAAKTVLYEARDEVQARGMPVPGRIDTGIMVEIPAAALRARQFAVEVDFFSVGTNDLTQYTLAAERGNAKVAPLADAFQPAVLELIQGTAEAARAAGKWAGVCGELAGDPRAVALLIGLGITELSMSAPAVPRAKQLIRELDSEEARRKALAALELETPATIRAALA
jgi:phosphocarrier protein FPr